MREEERDHFQKKRESCDWWEKKRETHFRRKKM